MNKPEINISAVRNVRELDGDKMKAFIETVRGLPENYRDMLIGAAFALEMSAGIDNDTPPTLPSAAKAAV